MRRRNGRRPRLGCRASSGAPRATSSAAEYGQASRALDEAAGLGEDELVAGLRHLAAAGWRARNGEPERARRQLAHARRRLAPFLPEAREVEVARLLEAVVESADGELA